MGPERGRWRKREGERETFTRSTMESLGFGDRDLDREGGESEGRDG